MPPENPLVERSPPSVAQKAATQAAHAARCNGLWACMDVHGKRVLAAQEAHGDANALDRIG